jgi:hypothetical protein
MEQIQQQEKKQTNEYEKRENKKRDSLYIRDFKKEQKQTIMTTRFSNKTMLENQCFREKHPKIKCVYSSPQRVASHIPLDSTIFMLEMNNDINRILGIGMICNHSHVGKYRVYEESNYNRYVYTGSNRIDRSELSEDEEKIIKFFDIVCFTGNKHMKRGQGFTIFPMETIFRIFKFCDINLVDYIKNMFLKRIEK